MNYRLSYKVIALILLMTVFSFSLMGGELALEEYLGLIRASHPFFLKEQLKVTIEEHRSERYLGGQEWLFSLTPSYTRLGEVSAGELVSNGEAADIGNLELEAQRHFWSTGGALALGVSSAYQNLKIGGVSDTIDSYTHGVSVSYVQPLLKNRGGVLDRLGYDVSRYNAERVKIEIAETREDFLLEESRRFLDWVLLEEQVRIATLRRELAEEQLIQVRRRYSSNLVDRVDVLRSEDAVRGAEQSLLQLNSMWKAKQAEHAVLAGDEGLYKAQPSFKLFQMLERPDIEADLRTLVDEARVLKPFDVILAQLSEQKRGLEEEMRSDLFLNLSGTVRGTDERIGDAVIDTVHPDFTVALEYQFPSGRTATVANIKEIDTQISQIREEKRTIVLGLQSSLRGLYIQMQDMEKILELGSEQIASAQLTTAEEQKIYNQGRGSLTYVIQSRDNEQNARLQHAANAALYHKLVLQYRALMDRLAP